MKLAIFIKDGKITRGREHIDQAVKCAENGIHVFSLTKQKSKSTAAMYRYLYGYVYPTILEEIGEQPTVFAINELDRELKERFGVAELKNVYELRREKTICTNNGINVEVGKPFVKITEKLVPKSKVDYSTQEMQSYWLALQQMAAEMWGLVLKDPDPDWKLLK